MMKRRVTFMFALGLGLTVAFVLTVAGIVLSFATQATLSVPGIIDISPAPAGEAPSVGFFFNPLAPLALALVIATAIWLTSRAAVRRHSTRAR